MVQIGKITSTHGIKGEVKIYSNSDFNRFLIGKKVYINLNKIETELIIKRARQQKNIWIVQFESFDNINDVLSFKGLDIYTKENLNESLEDDQYHYQHLIGKKVYTDKGVFVGLVSSMLEVPQGHIMEVEREGQKKY
jgi:16S rRNA processing protein RimM